MNWATNNTPVTAPTATEKNLEQAAGFVGLGDERQQQLALRRHHGSSSADRLNSYEESLPLPTPPPPPPPPMMPFAHGGRRYRVDTKPSLVV